MTKTGKFNKEKFARTIMKIYLKYSNQRDFSEKSEICRTYLSQYMNGKMENPPKPEILQRLANASKGMTTYEDLMKMCGYLMDTNETISNKGKLEQILALAEELTIQEANYLIKQLYKAKIKITKRR